MVIPTELQEQISLVKILRRSRILFAAVPNGGYRLKREAMSLRASGVRKGFPDMLVLDPPSGVPGSKGVALELKRSNGRPSDVRPEQKVWLSRLEAVGWVPMVAFGERDAVKKLRALGYELKAGDAL